MKTRIIVATLLLTAWTQLAHGQAVPVQGTVRAPASTLATLLQTPSLDPDNGGLLSVICDQNGTICANIEVPQDNFGSNAALQTLSSLIAYDGANAHGDRLRTGSATNLAAATQEFALMTTRPAQWAVTHSPAAATQATASKAAGGAGVQHVANGITACIGGAGANATIATGTTVNLRDGATGAGTVLWTAYLLNAAATSQCVTFSDLNLPGTANTAMTLEFAGAPAATSSQTVTLTGYSVQ